MIGTVSARSTFAMCVLALLAACTAEIPTQPLFTRATRARSGLVDRPAVHRNSEKYADAGGKPASGRSGNATVSALAMVGKTGPATVDVRTGQVDDVTLGTLKNVQVKQFDLDNTLIKVASYRVADNATAQFRLPSRQRGARVQVQASVVGVDGNRTDVVTVDETIKLRPDLEAGVSAPATAVRMMPTQIYGTVTERNRDLGARATCVLSVDGEEVDRATGIWVDAGDMVSCGFIHRFASLGARRITVSLAAVAPADYDDSNNSASATIDVVDPLHNDFTWSGQVFGNSNITGFLRGSGFWHDSFYGEDGEYGTYYEYRGGQRNLVIDVSGVSARGFAGPIDITFTDRIDQTQLHDDALTTADQHFYYEAGPYHQWCALMQRTKDFVGERGPYSAIVGIIWACTQVGGDAVGLPAQSTTFSYMVQGGKAEYYSDSWLRYAGPDYAGGWSFTGNITSDEWAYAEGDEYAFEITVSGAGGESVVGAGRIPLTAEPGGEHIPYGCSDYDDGQYFQRDCYESDISWTHHSGAASGTPSPP